MLCKLKPVCGVCGVKDAHVELAEVANALVGHKGGRLCRWRGCGALALLQWCFWRWRGGRCVGSWRYRLDAALALTAFLLGKLLQYAQVRGVQASVLPCVIQTERGKC